MIKLMVA